MLSDILSAETTRERKAKNLLLVYLDYLHSCIFSSLYKHEEQSSFHFFLTLTLYNVIVSSFQVTLGSERTYERSPVKSY